MLSFIIGGIYTLIVLTLGCVAGYFVGSRGAEEIADSVKRVRLTKSKVESGSLRPYTAEERQHIGDPAVKKMAEILEGFHTDK